MSGRITVGELQERMGRTDCRVLDVRTPGEFEAVHIPGSYNVPLDLLGEHHEELAALEGEVVLVCQSGARAARAGDTLAEAGMGNLRLLDGGISAWEAQGAPVRRAAARWSLERQVRLVAGAIVATATAVSVVAPPARFVAGAVGAGLVFAAVSNTCAMGTLLAKLPYNRAASPCDVGELVARLRTGQPA